MATINDQVATVQSLLAGRSDQAANIATWLLYGYRDIAHTIPFEELEQTENTICVPNIQTVDYPSDARAIKFISLGFPATNPTSARPLYKRNIGIVDRYASLPTGIPSIWAPFNTQIWMAQVPNDAYPLTVRYWQKVMVGTNADGSPNVNNTVLNVPDDWIEIIQYAAQERGWISLQELDKANAIHTLIWGDPMNRKKNPGLIKQRLTRIQAEYMGANYGFRPRLTRYGNVK